MDLLTDFAVAIAYSFAGFAIPVYIYFSQELGSDRHGAVSLRRWLDNQEGGEQTLQALLPLMHLSCLTPDATLEAKPSPGPEVSQLDI